MTLSSLTLRDMLEVSLTDEDPQKRTSDSDVTYDNERKEVFSTRGILLGSQAPIREVQSDYDDAEAVDDGFIDAFFMTTALHFFNVIHDLVHAFLFLLVLMAPWRLWELISDLAAPKHMADYVRARRLIDLFNVAEQHFLDYYQALMPRLNAYGKVEDRIPLSGWYWGWHMGYRQPVGKHDSAILKVEQSTLKPSLKLTKKVVKAMEDIDPNLPGVAHINALLSERRELQWGMITIPALKAGLYSESLSLEDDEFWSKSQSRHHAVLDMLLNVRTATNRTRLLQNRRHVKDTSAAEAELRAGPEEESARQGGQGRARITRGARYGCGGGR